MGGGGGEQEQQEQVSYAQLAAGDRALAGVRTPTAGSLMVRLQRAVYRGDITPIAAKIFLQKRSEFEGIEVDPELEEAQFDAIAELGRVATQQGLSDADKMQLLDISQQESGALDEVREGISEDFAGRDLGAGGLEQQAQTEAMGDAYGPGQSMRMDMARDAALRRMSATTQAGGLATGMQQQHLGEETAAATAQDAINRFNIQATNAARLANVQAAREAQERNIGERQRIADENVGIENRERLGYARAHQLAYDAELAKAGARGELWTTGATQAAGHAAGAPTPVDWGGALIGAGATVIGEHGPKAWESYKRRHTPTPTTQWT